MTARVEQLVAVVEELLSPQAGGPDMDVPVFRSMPSESTRAAAKRRGVELTAGEVQAVAATMTHPIAIGTWNMLAGPRKAARISGVTIAQPAFRYAIAMHAITVLLGLALLASSLVASLRGSPQLAAAIGALGLATFTALFLVAPLRALYRSLGRRVQLEVIGLGYQRQMDLYRMFAMAAEDREQYEGDAAVLPSMEANSTRTLQLIEALGHPDELAGIRSQAGFGAMPLVMSAASGLNGGPPVVGPFAVRQGSGQPPAGAKIFVEPKMIIMDAPPQQTTLAQDFLNEDEPGR